MGDAALWPRYEALLIADLCVDSLELSPKCEQHHSTVGKVKSSTIPDLLGKSQLARIDLLKLHIRPEKLELFRDRAEEWLPNVQVIIAELHGRFRRGCSQAFYRTLQNYDFRQNLRCEDIFARLNGKHP